MKRDMDLVRGLLLCVEVDGDLTTLYKQYSQEVVIGHLEIMMDANLLVGNVQS